MTRGFVVFCQVGGGFESGLKLPEVATSTLGYCTYIARPFT